MAASSPAPSSTASDSGQTPGSAAAASFQRTVGIQPKSQRGMNKPKCIQCGNVARSRCPFQCCKSCCYRAQNQCRIHVLKDKPAIPDKVPTSTTTPLDHQQSTEVSPATSSLRAASLRQLSSNLTQFNNLQTSRSRRPLTTKEALEVNKWRFNKLKEFKERNIEKENEAFDRYMQNISLLEEVFSMKSMQASSSQTIPPDPMASENLRKRKQNIIDLALNELEESEISGDRRPEKVKNWSERASAFNDLIEKLNKARNEDDIKSCLEMMAQLLSGQRKTSCEESVAHTASQDEAAPGKGMDCFSQNVLRPVVIDEETVSKVNVHFSSLQKIASL